MTAAIRGRIWRAGPTDISRIDRAEPEHLPPHWMYEVHANGHLVMRHSAPTHIRALSETCATIRLATQIDAAHGLTP